MEPGDHKMNKWVIIISLVVGILLVKHCSGPELDVNQLNNSDVVLYSAEWCGVCDRTRSYFDKNNIDYVEHDIEKSTIGRQQYNAIKPRNVIPIVVIKGELIMGYSEQKMRRALLSQ